MRGFGIGTAATAAAIGSLGSRRAPEVYARLRKPAWAPPAEIFGPIWTSLYAMIAVAGSRVARSHDNRLVTLHAMQLALNAAWPYTFFSARDRRAALAVIAVLDGLVAVEIAALLRRDRVAAALLAPYLLWSSYATALTVAVSDPSAAAAPRTGP